MSLIGLNEKISIMNSFSSEKNNEKIVEGSKDEDKGVVSNYGGEIIKLDDNYSIEVMLQMDAHGKIANIFSILSYHGEEVIGGKDYGTGKICKTDPDSFYCDSYKIKSSIGNINSYIICNGDFPSEKYELNIGQYESIKKGYDSFIDYDNTTKKCPLI